MDRFYTFIAVTSLISFLVTFGLSKMFKRHALVKYIPSIISAVAGIGFIIKARFFSNSSGFEDLGYIFLALMAGIVLIISLMTAVIMGQLQSKNKQD